MPPPNGSAMTWNQSSGGAGNLRWNVTIWVALFTVIASFTKLNVWAGENPAISCPGTKNCEMIQPFGNGAPELKSIVRVMEYFTSHAVIVSPFENFMPGRMWKV